MNSEKKKLYTHQRFVMFALDPIHIGAGGYRLGRVDNSIVREMGTNLPKIPGTSIAGAARSYASMRYGKPEAAGQHKRFIGEKEKCPIIYTFGTATETGGGEAGKVSFGDARILFFPVPSVAGPVWVTTKEILEEVGFTVNGGDVGEETVLSNLSWSKEQINLGWLSLNHNRGLTISPPEKIKDKKEWKAIENRIVLISQKLFSEVVNSNLEVRTSVAINPETGAAEDGALFTYEALPRATWLWHDIIEDDYKQSFPITENQFKDNKENSGDALGEIWGRPLDVVKAGLRLIEYLGIGGMGTRGFGRMKSICDWEVGSNGS
ncbi:CRISPR system Cmr endoribonuclease Cmr4 [Candidatus Methanoperedenaceae archaeon GB50]|nr:MAG: CRISPR system Cmr endoribonuclease Cmr4 [Candidatus Methanoperedenaceae archaeon GB50]CAD7774114.1 CRISPR system Cmr endoribonuclease Cmr4 [Candidatus Methanoperedenaceae archaeon GB50]